ncbi:ABC transporter substrate-binding protein [Pseudomonas sp. P5_152]|uniref:ABC transporter substrate-binding protein n=1 Tax=Pseudomonas sp. P5_152 TaxID=3043442 RepID=UPI002A36B478|nr:ABC transporter substrate-binding protein [Pseudomonas sp. P5_152]MDX9663696.1 ABC transporter substrate-binding protein [Pseudomonas sp. P5_152]
MKQRPATLLATLTLLAAALAGQVQAATPKDTVVMGKDITNILTLDPAETFEVTGGEVINNLYTRLFTYDPQDFSKLEGGVASDWKVSADGKQFSIGIRENLRFQSGNPIRAEDAAFSLRRVTQLGLTPSFILEQYGWTPQNVAQKVRVENGRLVLELNKRWAPTLVLNTLTSGVASIVDEKLAREHEQDGDLGHAWLKTHAAGSGAFSLKQWKAGDVVALDAFDGYYRGTPAIKRVILRHIPEPSAQRLLLEKGDIDIARDLRPEQVKALAGNPEVKLHEEHKVSELYLALNLSNPALAKPKVREALRWLIDYDNISEHLLAGQWFTHQTFIPKGVLGALDETPYKLNVQKARELLKEAGYADGFNITLDAANLFPWLQVSQTIQQSFASAGVKVDLRVVDVNQAMGRYRSRQYDAMFFYWSHDYNDPHSSAGFLIPNPDDSDASTLKAAAWRTHWKFPQPELVDQAAEEPDTQRRIGLYQDLQRKVLADSPYIFLLQQNEQTALRKNLSGFVSGPAFDTPVYSGLKKD